jgi:acetate kinase
LAKGNCERIAAGGTITHKRPGAENFYEEIDLPDHGAALERVLSLLTSKEYGVIESIEEIDAVGHRVAHGGEKIKESTRITESTIRYLEEIVPINPLHGPPAIAGMKACMKLMPEVPQVGVFDTSFYSEIEDFRYVYPIPYEYYEKDHVRRYGFHGTSHRYVSARVCEYLGIDPLKSKIVTAHIGNGGSCTAVMNGKSVDTSMGLTPLEGLVMGTRAGDMDLGAATYIMEKEGLSTAEFSNLMNKKSGLMGVSGVSSDARDIDAAVNEGNKRADLARRMFIYRVKKYIGAYAAAMNGVDVIVFTGGIGENDAYIRAEIIKGLTYLGIEFDESKNAVRGEERLLTTAESKVKVCIIPTDEEWMIASDTQFLIQNS